MSKNSESHQDTDFEYLIQLLTVQIFNRLNARLATSTHSVRPLVSTTQNQITTHSKTSLYAIRLAFNRAMRMGPGKHLTRQRIRYNISM
jgi:hypothetical protein